MEILPFSLSDEKSVSVFPYFMLFAQARKRAFVEGKGWPMPVIQNKEFDQYDLPFAHYLFAVNNGALLGGCRLIPCSNTFPVGKFNVTYMMKDAQDGTLSTIPATLADGPLPTTEDTWELSRLATNGGTVGLKLVEAAYDFVKQRNGKYCIFLGSPSFVRFGKRAGIDTSPIGPIVSQDTEKPYQAMRARVD